MQKKLECSHQILRLIFNSFKAKIFLKIDLLFTLVNVHERLVFKMNKKTLLKDEKCPNNEVGKTNEVTT
jgi:hypothetical protein